MRFLEGNSLTGSFSRKLRVQLAKKVKTKRFYTAANSEFQHFQQILIFFGRIELRILEILRFRIKLIALKFDFDENSSEFHEIL